MLFIAYRVIHMFCLLGWLSEMAAGAGAGELLLLNFVLYKSAKILL